ncbi:DUF779 domain-containing protein [uncultured Aquitalea sp.]|uniref:DUF779 domain-containing protein n=1 Tax=uncultured Aquitalea sp. TaxID=540272 RepID=UPI0025EA7747|nr:DUF779 domain-containing protein [uncultured Aquitalea sp.]
MTDRITATPAARALLQRLSQRHGPLLLIQSGGCCDGSVPLCYRRDEFHIGDHDILLGEMTGTPFYMSPEIFEYWKNCQLTLDAEAGRGGGFSLETTEDMRFITHSRLFAEDELAVLAQQENTSTS